MSEGKISEEQTTSQLRYPHLRRPNPKCDHLFHAVSCCFVLLGSRCWLWCFHVHLAIQIYLIQELWRCFNEWLQHLRSKKISLKPSLSLNDPVVVHATCVPRNKERCQFCLTGWPKQTDTYRTYTHTHQSVCLQSISVRHNMPSIL